MALKIRLQRHGASHRPFYRMVVTEAAARRDGRFVEVLGTYEPQASKPENELLLKLERIDYWKSVGAKATDTAASLIRRARRGFVDTPKEAPKAKKAPVADAPAEEAPAEEAPAEEAPAEEAPVEEAPAAEAEVAEAPVAEVASGPDCSCGNTQDPDGKCDGSHAKKAPVAEATEEAAEEAPATESKEADA